jgi:hypothetical protein
MITGWWFGTFFIFHNIWDVILPIDELMFFNMVKTTNQDNNYNLVRQSLVEDPQDLDVECPPYGWLIGCLMIGLPHYN